ncbi:DedA family protein [Ktedonosporobacter rubrisoli]|uniref:DedA family protein n=1 Tax=Ktedonosporobacter rubrisoli TaxID=2509675 RepID=A0A4P6K153_KTERU|nr:DedA family protein [Ktedonosporobacter rubrisoli]QBD81156.1 DedA family protein [Ktedonosporobacter rubrisoli]
MSTFLPLLLGWLQQYGYPVLWLSMFIASIGAPLPISFVLLAAGAFAEPGDFNIVVLALIGISASVSGDSVGYLIGRYGGREIFFWLGHQQKVRFISPASIARSRLYFAKRGGWAVFLSRFLFPALGGAINLLAGAEMYPFQRFFIYDLLGEALGTLIPLLLGYIFETSWEAIGNILATISILVTALIVAAYFAVRLIRIIRNMKTVPTIQRKASAPLQALSGSSNTQDETVCHLDGGSNV